MAASVRPSIGGLAKEQPVGQIRGTVGSVIDELADMINQHQGTDGLVAAPEQ